MWFKNKNGKIFSNYQKEFCGKYFKSNCEGCPIKEHISICKDSPYFYEECNNWILAFPDLSAKLMEYDIVFDGDIFY